MLDVHNVPASVSPLAQVVRSLAVFHAAPHGLGQQRIPVLVADGEPVGIGVHHNLFFRKIRLAPLVVLGRLAQFGDKNQRPQRTMGPSVDRCGHRVGAQATIPTAHQVCRSAQPVVYTRCVVNGISKAMRQFLIHLAVDVGLDGKHVFGGELVATLQSLVDALHAIGIDPLQRQRVRRPVGRHARVGRG